MVEPLTPESIKRANERYRPREEQRPKSHPPNGFFLDVPAYLGKYGIEVVNTKPHGSSTLYCLEHCIFDPSHNSNESAIGQTAEGKLFYQCFHNSCQGRTWREARQIISGNDPLFKLNIDSDEIANKRTAIQEKSKEPENKIEIISIESIANALIEDKPVIKGLLGEKESLLLIAPSGIGKSLLMNYLALTLGNPPLNGLWGMFHIPRMVKSLIVQSENGFNALNKRLNKLFKNCPEMKAGAENVFTFRVDDDVRMTGDLTSKDFQELLIDSLLSVGAEHLILDPLISYHGEDENDNAAMRRSLDCVTEICDRTNAASTVCHHTNRRNETRGASAIRDWAANMLLMDVVEKSGNSTILKVTHNKSRNYEQQPDFYLERTPDLHFLRCEKPGKQSQQITAVVTALKEMGGYVERQAPLKNAVMLKLNCSETKARRVINEAVDVGEIISFTGTGKGNPSSYKLLKAETVIEVGSVECSDDELQKDDVQDEPPRDDIECAILAAVDLDPLDQELERNRISKEYGIRKKLFDQIIKNYKKSQQEAGTKEKSNEQAI